jgi:hypothetical protein
MNKQVFKMRTFSLTEGKAEGKPEGKAKYHDDESSKPLKMNGYLQIEPQNSGKAQGTKANLV